MLDSEDMFTKNSISIRYDKLMEGYDFVHGPCFNLKEGRPIVRHKLWEEWIHYKTYKYVRYN